MTKSSASQTAVLNNSDDQDEFEAPILKRTVGNWPKTTPPAASSVFNQVKAPKPLRAAAVPFDMSAVIVRTDVPLPSATTGHGGTSAYADLLNRMQPGSSVQLPIRQGKSLVSRAKQMQIRVSARLLGPDLMGVWRLEPKANPANSVTSPAK